jgi:hypothetical protein
VSLKGREESAAHCLACVNFRFLRRPQSCRPEAALGCDGASHSKDISLRTWPRRRWRGAAVGGEAHGFQSGDEVFFYAEFAPDGTYAEYVAVDAAQVAKKPHTVSFVTAAALPTPGQAAWTALFDTA